jgi:hypothetical protein
MKIYNIKKIKNLRTIEKFGYLDNGNLAFLFYEFFDHIPVPTYRDVTCYDLYEQKFIESKFKNCPSKYNVNTIINNPEKICLDKHNYKDDHNLDWTVFHVNPNLCCICPVLGLKGMFVHDTNYGYVTLFNLVKNKISVNLPKIAYCQDIDKSAKLLEFSFEDGFIHSFVPSISEIDKFVLVQESYVVKNVKTKKGQIYLMNHNLIKIALPRIPVSVAFSPDNKNVALAVGDYRKSSSKVVSILDAETLEERYKMEMPFAFRRMTFSQDGLKLALIANHDVVEIDVE